MTTTIPGPRQSELEGEFDEDGNWYPTPEQWEAAVQRSLDRLGLTREELARQAEDDEFQSYEAFSLWFSIG